MEKVTKLAAKQSLCHKKWKVLLMVRSRRVGTVVPQHGNGGYGTREHMSIGGVNTGNHFTFLAKDLALSAFLLNFAADLR